MAFFLNRLARLAIKKTRICFLRSPKNMTAMVRESDRLSRFAQPKTGQPRPARLWYLVVLALIGSMIAVVAPPALAFDSHLSRYPYLTDLVGSFATINWATSSMDVAGSVRWGKADTESCTAHVTPATSTPISVNQLTEYQWKATLQLTPGTEYCYRIYLGSDPQIELLGSDLTPHFWTQVPAGSTQPFSFAVFGDWGAVDANGKNDNQANLMRQIAASGARFAVTTGDNAYPAGSQSNYGDLMQTGGDISGVFGPAFWKVAGASIALFPAMGNHGLGTSNSLHPQLLNFPQDNAVASSGGRYEKETYCCLNGTQSMDYASAWFAFDAGIARFYIIHAAWSEINNGNVSAYQNDHDYHWTAQSAEYKWLLNDLATHPSALKFAFFHYPLHSDNPTETSDTYLQGPNSLEEMLSHYQVNMVFNGHAHIYQRNLKSNGLISYITGGGGAKLEPLAGVCSAIDAYALGWSYATNAGNACGSARKPTSISSVFHFLLVNVNGTQVTVTPIDSRGRSFDVQTYDFGNGADSELPSAPADLTATVKSNTSIALSWKASTDNVGVTGYTILRDGTVLATVKGNIRTYSDLSALPGVSYTYTVEAFDAAGNHSLPSNAVVVTTYTTDTEPPSAPADLTVTAISLTRVDLAWSASTDNVGVFGYTIARDGKVLATVKGNTLAYSDTSVAEMKTYSYTIVASDQAGNRSVPSGPIVVNTLSIRGFIPIVVR